MCVCVLCMIYIWRPYITHHVHKAMGLGHNKVVRGDQGGDNLEVKEDASTPDPASLSRFRV